MPDIFLTEAQNAFLSGQAASQFRRKVALTVSSPLFELVLSDTPRQFRCVSFISEISPAHRVFVQDGNRAPKWTSYFWDVREDVVMLLMHSRLGSVRVPVGSGGVLGEIEWSGAEEERPDVEREVRAAHAAYGDLAVRNLRAPLSTAPGYSSYA